MRSNTIKSFYYFLLVLALAICIWSISAGYAVYSLAEGSEDVINKLSRLEEHFASTNRLLDQETLIKHIKNDRELIIDYTDVHYSSGSGLILLGSGLMIILLAQLYLFKKLCAGSTGNENA